LDGPDLPPVRHAAPCYHSHSATPSAGSVLAECRVNATIIPAGFVETPMANAVFQTVSEQEAVMSRKLLADYFSYLAVRIVICLIQCLTIDACRTLSRCLAVLFTTVIRVRRGVVDENLRSVFPNMTESDRKALAFQMWEHLFLLVCEIAQIRRKMHDTNWRDCVTFTQQREIVRCLLDRRPKVLVSGHFGNFEIASYLAGLFGFRTYAIARPLDNPFLHRYVNAFREAKGQFILDKEGSAGTIAELLRRGATLSLLGDQYAGPKGCWVDFLGRPASCHKALALFTLSSQAPMMVMTCVRDECPLHFRFGPEGIADPRALAKEQSSVPGLTRWYNAMLEQAIRRDPEQYWWVHRRWKGTPPRRSAAAA
jgi:KDO2-lipid IV(A) lauroyltransferase